MTARHPSRPGSPLHSRPQRRHRPIEPSPTKESPIDARIAVLCFPASDTTFAALATQALAALPGERTPEALAAALRPTYPSAVVRRQDATAALGFGERWYAFRDGRLAPIDDQRWWDRDDLARVVIDETDRYAQADDAACALFGLGPGELVGRSWEEFAEPAAADAAEALRQTLQRQGHGDSTFRLTRPDGTRFDIDHHTVVYMSGGSVLYETVMRERPTREADVATA